jgi:RNA polymerase sigma-70 factor, ECF subfamily
LPVSAHQPDERRLIESAKQDRRRFAELYEKNFDRVYAYIARRVDDRSDAEDVTSEVFHHALAHLEQFEWRGVPFVAWLYRIAANALADRYAKATREPETPATAENEDAAVDDVERRAMLSQLVNRLPPEQRRVVMARFVEQRSIREIARELQRSEGAVKQLQFRALQALRTRWEDTHA